MPGPETDSPPEQPTQQLHPAVDVSELESARAQLGRERTHAAHTRKDNEGITKLENDPTKFDEDPDSTTTRERRYWAKVRGTTQEGAEKLKAEGADTEHIQTFVRERIIDELLQRAQAEIEAKNNPDTLRGKLQTKLVNAVRTHRKTRIAVGVALSLGAVAAASTGLGGVAIAAVAVRSGLSAIGGYIAAKDLQEVGGNKFSHSEGKWWNFGHKGELAPLQQEKVDQMNADERLEHLTRILAAKARTTRTDQQSEGDQKSLDMLLAKEREDIDKRLETQQEKHFGANLIHGTLRVLDERLTQQLAAERKQLIEDKKIAARRTAIATGVAAALGTYGMVAGITQDGLILGRHAAGAAHHIIGHSGGGPSSTEHIAQSVRAAEAHAGHVAATHTASLEHYPEIITDHVDKGDTPVRVAMKHLSRIQGWSHFNADQQHEKIMHFANQLTRHGEHWRYTKEAIKGSFNFDHGAVQPDHMMPGSAHSALPSYDHVAPSGSEHMATSGGGEHVLPNGGVQAPDTHEFALAPDSPEIVTQPAHFGDTALGVAKQHLGRLPGWSVFSPDEQHDKALHFANQLRKSGDHWRYTKEAILASFNFKR